MKKKTNKMIVVFLMMGMVLSPGHVSIPANAASGVSLASQSTSVKEGQSRKVKIKANGYIIKKVIAKSKNKTIALASASKSSVEILGQEIGSTKVIVTIKASKNGKTRVFKKNISVSVKSGASKGKVLNIYTWNEEFMERFREYYSGYDDDTYKIGDVAVRFIMNVNEGSNYQDRLDEALDRQNSASAFNKVDMFMAESDYVNKYISADEDVAIPVSELGITSDDMSQMFDYTKQAATDENGVLRGLSWQAYPSGMIYRRSLAKKYFGTDDPDVIQDKVSNWDKFKEACETIKTESKGKDYMLATAFDLRKAFTSNDSTKIVNDGKLSLTTGLSRWADTMQEYINAGYIMYPKKELWSEDWSLQMNKNKGRVFAYFGPSWFIDFTMSAASGARWNGDGSYAHKDGKDSYGDWAVCKGPQSFDWGGTYLIAAKGTDNKELVGDIIREMTCDKEVLYRIATEKLDFVNNKTVCDWLSDEGRTCGLLSGQDMISVLKDAGDSISITNGTPYDQYGYQKAEQCIAEFLWGKHTKEEAIAKWKKQMKKMFPNLDV